MTVPQHPGLRLISRFVLLAVWLSLLAACAHDAGLARPVAGPVVDPMEASMAGEFALQGGQLPEAARHYLDAARAAGDPVLAERATRIALLADADSLARQAWDTWHALAPQPTPDQHMLAASLALRAGRSADARRQLGALYADGNWQMALAALAGAVGKQPKLVVRLLGDAIDGGVLPNDLGAWLGYGGLAERLDQQPLVDRIVAQVVTRFPDDPRVALLRAQLLRQSGKLDEARKVLAALDEPARLVPNLRWALAGEYDALGDPAKAAEVLARGEQDESSYAQRALLLDKAGDTAGLGALYAELKRGATNPNPLRRLLLGQIAELLKHYDEALSWYASVPGERLQSQVRLRRANVLHAKGDKEAAYAALHAIEADAALDDDARRNGYQLEADLRHKDKDVPGEREAFARALAAFPDNLDLLYARAIMWERQDEIAKAEADFRRILVIEPDNVATLNALGYTLADRTTRYREALELIDRARVADPGNAAITDSYGWVLFKLGRRTEALDYLRRAYALQKDPDIASHLAQVLWVLGDKDEARRYFDEARKLDPENRSLLRALQETGA
ncbi:MAG: tetratricopeptide repeat protein [Thermomonas sp.]|uniref:tetratricopeptide repeat protein n=1 Tax=Thermomonas sp. TaxID=1971895 RepID=UPI001DCED07D|nr:tetratricopeptide repeat protein [Thermomonas sp.]MBZ0088640.1 tetratricopeptide repeat protein [Thermomonas sp.]MCO5056042.1 tetratricopeptide repeat protein [Thermomonas sp.]